MNDEVKGSATGYNGPQPQGDPNEKKVLVKFRVPFPPWQTNEIAGFPESRAMELVKPRSANLGGPFAVLYVPSEEERKEE